MKASFTVSAKDADEGERKAIKVLQGFLFGDQDVEEDWQALGGIASIEAEAIMSEEISGREEVIDWKFHVEYHDNQGLTDPDREREHIWVPDPDDPYENSYVLGERTLKARVKERIKQNQNR